jgi:beta-xylosidase
VEWKDGWPVLASVTKGESSNPVPGIVNSDEFSEETLPLVWQWNHNPVTNSYSLTKRPGFLRLINSRVDTSYTQARNTLTQRTYGPECSGMVKLDISGMKEGDVAGLSLLQKQYGLVGVTINEDSKAYIKMFNAEKEVESVPLEQKTIYLKAECDFKNRADMARFFYSLDGEKWIPIGNVLKMVYTLPHFMGYRFGLFSYATKSMGGFADFDYFHVSGQTGDKKPE